MGRGNEGVIVDLSKLLGRKVGDLVVASIDGPVGEEGTGLVASAVSYITGGMDVLVAMGRGCCLSKRREREKSGGVGETHG